MNRSNEHHGETGGSPAEPTAGEGAGPGATVGPGADAGAGSGAGEGAGAGEEHWGVELTQELVRSVLDSPVLRDALPSDRDETIAAAQKIVGRQAVLGRLDEGLTSVCGLVGLAVAIGAVIVLRPQLDEWIGRPSAWAVIGMSLLVMLYVLAFLAPLMFMQFLWEDGLYPESWPLTIAVFAGLVLASIAVMLAGGWWFHTRIPGGAPALLILVVAGWVVVSVVGGLLLAVLRAALLRVPFVARLDPRDRLYFDLIDLLGVAVDILSPEPRQWPRHLHLFPQPADEGGWREDRGAQRAYGARFEEAARSVEDTFHSIVPRTQGAARAAVRETGQRIAATLRTQAVLLMVDRPAFEAEVVDQLATAVAAASRGDWRALAIAEAPPAATRLLRRHGPRWGLALVLVAAAIVVPELAGSVVEQVFPGFRTAVISAAILLVLEPPASAVKWIADGLRSR